MKRNYRFDPNPVNTHMLLLNEIAPNTRVLEVGTASGYLGEYLIHEKKCEVWGIEPVRELYVDAESVGYTKLVNKTVEECIQDNDLKDQKFDYILLGDVLEHMTNPHAVMKSLREYLKPEGKCVISLPNVAHYSIRWALLRGKWDMTDSGIMDRTHFVFFTRKTIREMIEQSGYKIVLDRPSGGYMERWGQRRVFGIGRKILFTFPNLFSQQFIVVAGIDKK